MKVAVFYYSQSGQALRIAEHICKGIKGSVVFREIVPQRPWPFPWSRKEFFDIFPETRLGLPPFGNEPMDFSDIEDTDIVMVVGQSWFLSPSLPLQSFFTDPQVMAWLCGRPVVFVNACRNMWLMTSRKVKDYLKDARANMVGQIILQDRRQNLVSALTVVRWLMHGKKEASGLLPDAGVSEKDISEALRFGEIIDHLWQQGCLDTLQEDLLAAGAIHYKPSILFLEKAGHRMFGLWARFIRRKGGFGDKRRQLRATIFYYYLLTVMFLVSPWAQLVFWLTYPLHLRKKQEY